MIRALLFKELRQHAGLCALLGVVLLLGLWLVVGNPLLSRALGSGFEGLRGILCTLLPIGALLLGNALIAAEFRHKTQLFLEGLPLPRWRLLVVKYALLHGVLLLLGGMLLVAAWWVGRRGEAMTLSFTLLVSVRTLAWLWFLGAFFFCFGFLGRYRIAAFALVVVFMTVLSPEGIFDLTRVPPFSLLDSRFAFERDIWPGEALAVAVGCAVVFTALGFVLGSVRDATVATLLAEKMSSREKIVVTMFVLGGLVASAMYDDKRESQEPVNLPGAIAHERAGRVSVQVATTQRQPSPADDAAFRRAGEHLADRLAAFSQQLGDATLPAVFLVHRASFDAHELQDGKLRPSQGVLVRVNLRAADAEPGPLERWVLRGIFKCKTMARSDLEELAWVVDALPVWWLAQSGTDADASTPLDDTTKARAREAVAAAGLSAITFREWLSVRAAAGDENAEALGAVALQALARRRGVAATWAFAAACFAEDLPNDLRGWVHALLHPVEGRLRRTANTDYAQLAQWTQEELDAP